MAAQAHEIDNSECFIIGAGFSKAIHERFSTLSELSGTVWSRLKQKGKSLNKFEGSQFTEDIEIFLSNIAKDQPWLKNEDYFERKSIYEAALQTIVEEIESSVFEVFRDKKSELETNLNNWLCNLFRYWHRNQSTIITFNYDTLIERLFWAAADHSPERIGIEDPDDAPVTYDLYLQNMEPIRSNQVRERQDMKHVPGARENTFSLLKLHGSTNWYYSGSGNYPGERIYFHLFDDLLYRYRDVSADVFSGFVDRHQQRKKEVAERDPFIVPPLLDKTTLMTNSTLRLLWRRAYHVIEQSTEIYCLGYSLPLTDLPVRSLLMETVRGKGAKTIYPVNFKEQSDFYLGTESKISVGNHYENILPDRLYNVDTQYLDDENPIPTFANSI